MTPAREALCVWQQMALEMRQRATYASRMTATDPTSIIFALARAQGKSTCMKVNERECAPPPLSLYLLLVCTGA